MAIVRNDSFPYDLVFCDLMMPDVNGMDIFEAIREQHPGQESRVVFVTGPATPLRAMG